MERNDWNIFEFGNSDLLMGMLRNLVPRQKSYFSDHLREIIVRSVVRVMDNQPLRLIKSR